MSSPVIVENANALGHGTLKVMVLREKTDL